MSFPVTGNLVTGNLVTFKLNSMLLEKIHGDLIAAMKSGDAERRDVLRFLESDLKKRAIDARKEALSDEEAQKVVASHVKARKDSVLQFRSGGREDLAIPEEAAILILESYLPEQMSDVDLEAAVREALSENGITDAKEMGRAMGAVMKRIAGRADGNRVKVMVGKILASNV